MLKSINRYIINEYIKSLFIVIAVMLSIILLINLLDEFNFFKSKKDLKFIFFIIFTLLKIPNVLVNLFPFIILFGGIVFYLKIYNHNEVISLRVMGYSNIQIILIPALTSFVIGYLIIFLIVPFSSSMVKYYEELRSQYNETKNLVFVNETGIWVIDKNEKEKNIITNFTHKLFENIEDERKRISTELHDNVNHELLALKRTVCKENDENIKRKLVNFNSSVYMHLHNVFIKL